MKRLVKFVVLAGVFFGILAGVSSVLRFKYGDGILGIELLQKQEENSVDVLILGSSHAFENVNTGIMWNSYGIPAYVLSGSMQPYWNTWHYLSEALETQHPKLVVLEAFASTYDFDYSDHSRIIKNNLGIQNPANRYSSLQISSPAMERDNYIFEYRLWHSRYEELSDRDFQEFYTIPLYQYYKGFGINFATREQKTPQTDHIKDELPMREKSETWFRKILELCQEQKINVMVVVAPYTLSERDQLIYNYTERVAKEYDVPFVNFNSSQWYETMELDFQTDMADADHLNHVGNEKFTHTLVEEIKQWMNLPDRRGSSLYDSWDMHAKDVLRRTENHWLARMDSPEQWLSRLSDLEDYKIVISTITHSDNMSLRQVLSSYQPLVNEIYTLEDLGLYVCEGGRISGITGELEWEYEEEFCTNRLQISSAFVRRESQIEFVSSLRWNGQEYMTHQSGCYILCYDEFVESLVAIMRIYLDENGKCVMDNLLIEGE